MNDGVLDVGKYQTTDDFSIDNLTNRSQNSISQWIMKGIEQYHTTDKLDDKVDLQDVDKYHVMHNLMIDR